MNVGLFFGSFNPIHNGHLIIANLLVQTTDLREVWFVVSPQNPFKKKESLLDEKHRLYMTNLALEDNFALRASSIEFKLPRPSYTIDTVVHLQEKHPGYEFGLIMGSDNLAGFKKWKNYERLLEKTRLYVYPRPGAAEPELAQHEKVRMLDLPFLHISASFIRKLVKEGLSPRYLVPDKVLNHIEEMHFYK